MIKQQQEDKFSKVKALVDAKVEEGDGGSDNNSDKSVVEFDLMESTKDILFTSSLNWLLLLIPVAVVAKNMGVSDGWLFVFSLLPICPLAGAHPLPRCFRAEAGVTREMRKSE